MTEIEIFQREYAFGLVKHGVKVLRTTKVETCVVWCGVDASNELGFLFHFDWPSKTEGLDEKLVELKSLCDGVPHFNSYIWGGRKYAKCHEKTREIIEKVSSGFEGATFDLKEQGLSPLKISGDGYKINIVTGKPEQCSGKVVLRKGFSSWACNQYQTLFPTKLKKAPGSA